MKDGRRSVRPGCSPVQDVEDEGGGEGGEDEEGGGDVDVAPEDDAHALGRVSHVTRHTSHVTRHTSHVIHQMHTTHHTCSSTTQENSAMAACTRPQDNN